MGSFMEDSEDLSQFILSSSVGHAWRRFVLCSMHLRFADCAEQQDPVDEAVGPLALKLVASFHQRMGSAAADRVSFPATRRPPSPQRPRER